MDEAQLVLSSEVDWELSRGFVWQFVADWGVVNHPILSIFKLFLSQFLNRGVSLRRVLLVVHAHVFRLLALSVVQEGPILLELVVQATDPVTES